MVKRGTLIGMTIVFLAMAFLAHAEKATEVMIPIGQSPGLSGKYTVQGNIDLVNTEGRTLTLSDTAGSYTVIVTKRTFIYLDRSNIRQANAYGSLADCRPGQKVEVKWVGNDRSKPAEWIKVQNSQ